MLEIYDGLQIDAEWTVWDRRGFTWWPHRHAQRVWAEEGVDSFGQVVYRVHVETEWGSGEAIADRERQAAVAVLMGSMSLAGVVVSGEELRWHTHAVIHEENRAWLTRLLEIASLVQATSVELGGDILDGLELRPATSGHPRSGERLPDEALRRSTACRCATSPRPSMTPRSMRSWACSNGSVLTSSVAFGGVTASLTQPVGCRPMTLALSIGERASIGVGVRVTCGSPRSPRRSACRSSPSTSIAWRRTRRTDGTSLGSWAADLLDDSEPTPFFTCFVPNVTLRPGVVPNLVLSMGAQAAWIESNSAEPAEQAARSVWTRADPASGGRH